MNTRGYLGALGLVLTTACSGSAGNCTVVDNADGTATISCPDGTKAIVHGGQNGAAGDAGANGESELVRLVPEPPGKNCTYGGTAIETGIDTNGDGVLEDSEVTSTSYVCAGAGSTVGSTIEGTYYIHNSFDVALLAGVTTITGDLDIDAPGLTGVSLPQLTSVGGMVYVTDSSSLVTLDLSALTAGDIQLGALNGTGGIDALTTLKLPVLAGALNNFVVSGAYVLTTLSAPLVTSAAYFGIVGDIALTSISCPALTTAQTFDLETLPALTTASFPKLTSVTNFTISNTALPTLSLLAGLTTFQDGTVSQNASLTSISDLSGVTGTIDGLQVQYNPLLANSTGLGGITAVTSEIAFTDCAALTDLTGLTNLTTVGGSFTASEDAAMTNVGAPALTTVGYLDVDTNAALVTLDLGNLTTVTTEFIVVDNSALKQCLADALLAQLTTVPTMAYSSGNTGTGVCP
jgi:hypothetical protein